MKISANTKISTLLKAHPDALDTIVAINNHYKKLKNPVLRKVMASRVSIADAARIAGISVEEFVKPLKPLGFVYADAQESFKEESYDTTLLHYTSSKVLDVRDLLQKGKDPFNVIMGELKLLQEKETLLLITSFIPTPLIKILQKKGFKVQSSFDKQDLIKTFITKLREIRPSDDTLEKSEEAFTVLKSQYVHKMLLLNVKDLEMPKPMMVILKAIETLPEGHALYVLHKKVPLYLLPELQELGFEAHVFIKADDDVELIIHKSEACKSKFKTGKNLEYT